MLSNLGKALRRGFYRVRSPFSKIFNFAYTAYGYLGPVKLAKKLPGFAINQKVFCEARTPATHKHQECKYISSKCHEAGLKIETEASTGIQYLEYKKVKYPITRVVGSGGGEAFDVHGNQLFAINTAGENHYSNFESKLEKDIVLVVAYDGTKCVDPVIGRGNRRVFEGFSCEVYPFSFSVMDHVTKEVNFPLSLIMLPLNLSGLVIGCAGRLSAGMLSAFAKGLNFITERLSEKVDKKIIHQQSGVLVRSGKPYFSMLLIFTLSTVANLLSAVSCFIKNSADLTESVVRFPSGLANGIYNYNMKCVPVRAGAAAIVKSARSLFTDLGNSCTSFAQPLLLSKARLCGDAEALKASISVESGFLKQQEQVDDLKCTKEELEDERKELSRSDFEKVSELGKSLGAQVLYGTDEDINKEYSKQKRATSRSL
ncbi:hypothetical protein K6025_01730 [Ehrlichia sp. JZT12]